MLNCVPCDWKRDSVLFLFCCFFDETCRNIAALGIVQLVTICWRRRDRLLGLYHTKRCYGGPIAFLATLLSCDTPLVFQSHAGSTRLMGRLRFTTMKAPGWLSPAHSVCSSPLYALGVQTCSCIVSVAGNRSWCQHTVQFQSVLHQVASSSFGESVPITACSV